jgi:bifunctional enzyme CysN/CysC
VEVAFPPMSVNVTLKDHLDISRGDMLVHPHNLPRVERHFEAMLVWMSETPMDLNRAYLIKHTTKTARARIDQIRYKVDVNTLNRAEAAPLRLNEIGRVILTAHQPLFADAYNRNRATGCFILIDMLSNNTVAAGMIIDREPSDRLPARVAEIPAERPVALHAHRSQISPAEREERFAQKPATIWLTGLAASGKTEIAYALERRLFDLGGNAVVLDGENFRLGLSRDLEFSTTDIAEHIRRVAETARVLNEAGLIVICAFVSPLVSLRAEAAQIIGGDRFLEVFVDAPLEWCEARDKSGLYEKARRGEIKNVAGVNSPYETPNHPGLALPMTEIDVGEAVSRLLQLLRQRTPFLSA